MIDVSKISLYIEFAPNKKTDKLALKHSTSSESEIDRYSARSFGQKSNQSKQTDGVQSQRSDYFINGRDVKGVELVKAEREDLLTLKLIYLLDAKHNQHGFLILSEKSLSIGEIMDKQDEKIEISME